MANDSTYSLNKLLDEYKIVIPIIQRDYAQGRKGRETIRKNLITDIHNTLLSDNGILSMDFVYGEVSQNVCGEEKTLYPLDGQQRLTTLWLVHWYTLFMVFDDKRDKSILKKLQGFKYETRDSASDFCEYMCDLENVKDLKKAKEEAKKTYSTISVSELIRSRTWFMSQWLNDPTIDAMLRTLSGDEDSQKACIEEIFNDNDDYESFRNKLFGEEGKKPIYFELQLIGNKKMPPEAADEIYIKMNARGKALSDFENFKSDLIAWFNDDKNEDKDKYMKTDIGKNKTNAVYFASQIDNDWTDVFWKEVQTAEVKDFDPAFFSFINRIVVNDTVLKKKDNSEWMLKESKFKSFKKADYETECAKLDDEQKKIKESYDKLSGDKLKGKNADDSKVKYDDFHYYRDYLTYDSLEKLDVIFGTLKNTDVNSAIKEVFRSINASYFFIPTVTYDKNEHRSFAQKTENQERIYFYATCRFILANEGANEDLWKHEYDRWMRIVHNLVRNYYFNDVSDMVVCMRLIANLSDRVFSDSYSLTEYGIYRSLTDSSDNPAGCDNATQDNTIGDVNDDDIADGVDEAKLDDDDEEKVTTNEKVIRFNLQLKEEIEKARAILEEKGRETKIKEAENYAFFNGTIRFLYYTVDDNKETRIDWDKFNGLFESAKIWFPEDKGNTVPVETVQSLLSMYNNFSDLKDRFVFIGKGYEDRDYFSWKRHILCNEKLRTEIREEIRKLENKFGDIDDIKCIKDAVNMPMITITEDKIKELEKGRLRYLCNLVGDAVKLQKNINRLLRTKGNTIIDKKKDLFDGFQERVQKTYYAFVNDESVIQEIISNDEGKGKIRVSPYISEEEGKIWLTKMKSNKCKYELKDDGKVVKIK